MPPLPKGEVLEANLSVCFADSSPNRGATGETVLAVLDEQSSSFPETAGLRCRDSRLLAQHPLLERSSAATANEDRARCFASHRAQANSRTGPACQGLPYQGSWREAPERLYQGTLSSKNRLLSQARRRGCTPCHVSILHHGSRKATLRTTSPSPAVTPLLVGEALASRKLYFFIFSRSARSSLGVM